MKNIFRIGMIAALLVIIASGYMALKLVFSDTPELEVPPLVGLDMTSAMQNIEALGLVAKIDMTDSTLPQSSVISQWPEPKTLIAKGKVVLLKISKGTERTSIPDIRGIEYGEAVRRLGEAGLKVSEVLKVPDQEKLAGIVIAQNPASPAMVPITTGVSLLVSEGSGADKGLVSVPNIAGQRSADAVQMLAQLGLTATEIVEVNTTSTPQGIVMGSLPRAGAKVPSGSKITVRVAKEPPEEPVTPPQDPTPKPTVVEQPAQPTAAQPTVAQPTAVPQEKPQPTAAPQPQEPQKMAKIRYQVPPLSRAMELKIELADNDGSRTIKEIQAKGGEYVTVDAPYAGEARVTIYLGGEFVWQDRFE